MNSSNRTLPVVAFAWLFSSVLFSPFAAAPLRAADHGDAPSVDQDSGADIADAFFFLDPNDNSKAILAMTVHGFIVPGEAGNFANFDPKVKYLFEIENTGDAEPDMFINVRFSEKPDASSPQTALIEFVTPGKRTPIRLSGPTTPATLAAVPNAPNITTDASTGISFFAGEVDDPFFFDLVAFNRFVASVKAGRPDATVFQRARDTFAGYNALAIALSVPTNLLRGNSGVVGLAVRTQRQTQTPNNKSGGFKTVGNFLNVDRMGNPAVNVALIPFARKDEYNIASTKDDAKGRFAADIIASLKTFGTDDTSIGILAGVAVTKGDFLHLDLGITNVGPSGGTNPQAAFPNGRRLADDTIDTILTLINNRQPLGDNVNANDVPLRNEFPFFAPPQQPRNPGVLDDNTRN